MKNEQMPERIHMKPYKQAGCYRLYSDDRTESGDVEYVRADLAQGDANERLEDGQRRWVGVMFSDENITILTPPGMTEVDFRYIWPTKPCRSGERVAKSAVHDYAEYVRAGVVLSDQGEPLKNGQYRWVRHKGTPGILDVARVSVDYDGVWMNETGGDAYKSDQYAYIGPVIRPHEE